MALQRAVCAVTLDELALAYELHVAGCSWKRIAIGLGHDNPEQLYTEVRRLRRFGIEDSRRKVSAEQLQAALVMREHSRLSWNAVARHLGVSTSSIVNAVYRHKKARHEAGQSLSQFSNQVGSGTTGVSVTTSPMVEPVTAALIDQVATSSYGYSSENSDNRTAATVVTAGSVTRTRMMG